MLLVVKGLGMLVAGMGALFFLQPAFMRRFMAWIQVGKRLYGIGAFRFLAGLALLVAAPQCSHPPAAVVLGSLFVLSAITVFAIGPGNLDGWFRWWDGQSNTVLRLMALIAVTFGLLILSVA